MLNPANHVCLRDDGTRRVVGCLNVYLFNFKMRNPIVQHSKVTSIDDNQGHSQLVVLVFRFQACYMQNGLFPFKLNYDRTFSLILDRTSSERGPIFEILEVNVSKVF